jgi:hypothetical protein
MPTIPLYDTSAHPDGWHRVMAPGGYELWHLEAEDTESGIRLTVDLIEGDQVNREYMRTYRRYRRRPTRVAPPLPQDYPSVRVRMSEGRRTLWKLDLPQPPGALQASTTAPEITLGPCVVRRTEDGGIRFSMEVPGLRGGPRCSFGDLTFHPAATGCGYEVIGTLQERHGAVVCRDTKIRGHGRYEHTFAVEPIRY